MEPFSSCLLLPIVVERLSLGLADPATHANSAVMTSKIMVTIVFVSLILFCITFFSVSLVVDVLDDRLDEWIVKVPWGGFCVVAVGSTRAK
jgi:hypothetical protein